MYLIDENIGKNVLAESGGFEPPVELLTLQRFSKPPPSATRPSLRVWTDYTGSSACGAQRLVLRACPGLFCLPAIFPFQRRPQVVRFAIMPFAFTPARRKMRILP